MTIITWWGELNFRGNKPGSSSERLNKILHEVFFREQLSHFLEKKKKKKKKKNETTPFLKRIHYSP